MKKHSLLNLFLILAISLAAAGLAKWVSHTSLQFAPADQAMRIISDFSLPDLTGHKLALSRFRNSTVLVNFWASWCPPCIAEFPELLRAAQQRQDTFFLLVTIDKDESAIHKFLNQLPKTEQTILQQKNILILRDEKQTVMQNIFHVEKIPESFLLNGSAAITQHWQDGRFLASELLFAIDQATAQPGY